jgi:hypothetical protein
MILLVAVERMSWHKASSMGAGPPSSGAGYTPLVSEVTCVVTRFELRSAWSLPWMWLSFRRVRAGARGISGLLRSAFLVESPRVCFIFSIWSGDAAVLEFGTHVHAHVHAARHTFRRTFNPARRRAEVWSTQWRLGAVSNNLSWQDFDLATVLDEAGRRAVEAARLDPAVRRGRRA